MLSRIYLDYNATTPLHPELLAFVTEGLSRFGNPSSVHGFGRDSKKLITTARNQIASFINVSPLEIVFTATGSEANNQAIQKALPLLAGVRDEIYYSAVEHPSVIKAVKAMVARGYKPKVIPVLPSGEIDLEFIKENLNEKTALVTVQLVNNETGNIFPVAKIGKLAHKVGALMHSDMVQALGKIPVDLKTWNLDLATFAGHKFYSLKGAAFLFVRSGTHVDPLIYGGGQERSRRAGTENALAIASLGEAVRVLGPRLNEEVRRIEILRDALENEILRLYPHFTVNGKGAPRVCNTLNITCPNIDGETFLINLDTRGVAVSSGAACSSGSQEPSPVLRAMGLDTTQAQQSMRISLGWLTTEEELKTFLGAFQSSLEQMVKTNVAEMIV